MKTQRCCSVHHFIFMMKLMKIPQKTLCVIKPVLALVGFSFLPVLIYEAIFFLAIVIHHSNISITEPMDMLYRKLFSSPLMHRIHHSNKQKETDSNYGSVFSFWDRIFKTYIKKPEEPVVFGVDEKQG